VRSKLELTASYVTALEAAGLPRGWTRAWDASRGAYYFAEPTLRVSSWEDPRSDPTVDESALPPPPPPPPEAAIAAAAAPATSAAWPSEADWLKRSTAKAGMHPERAALVAARAAELAAEGGALSGVISGEGAGEGAGEGVSEDAGGMLVGGLPGGAALVERRDDANVSSNASERRVGGRRGRSGTAPANDHRDRAPVASRSCVLL